MAYTHSSLYFLHIILLNENIFVLSSIILYTPYLSCIYL